MIVNEISLTHFKNYENLKISFHPSLNVFVGKNGMGKTNLMDGVYFIAFCKSNFQRQDRNIVTHNLSYYRIESNLTAISGKIIDFRAVVEIGKPKRISINQSEYDRISHHLGLIPLIIIGPNDIHNLLAGSEERRKLIDSCICQIDKPYTRQLIEYTRLLKQRNSYIKSLLSIDQVDISLLESFNHQMAGRAKDIYLTRQKFIDTLNPSFSSIYQAISNQAEHAQLRYISQLENSDFLDLCKANLKKDLILKRTSAGIHKDDLELALDGKPLKTFGSQGQLKSFVLALKLAQYHYLKKIGSEIPVLLLDDIFDKLDRTRVKSLIQYLIEHTAGQIFITDTSEDRVSSILQELNESHKVFEIESGKIKSEYEK